MVEGEMRRRGREFLESGRLGAGCILFSDAVIKKNGERILMFPCEIALGYRDGGV